MATRSARLWAAVTTDLTVTVPAGRTWLVKQLNFLFESAPALQVRMDIQRTDAAGPVSVEFFTIPATGSLRVVPYGLVLPELATVRFKTATGVPVFNCAGFGASLLGSSS